MAAVADWIYPGDPWDMSAPPLLWPGEDPSFPLGSDTLGRDIAAGLFHGARESLLIGSVATVAAVVFGTAVGAVAGYFGGAVDIVLMRLTELVQTLPPFLFAVVLIAILGPRIDDDRARARGDLLADRGAASARRVPPAFASASSCSPAWLWEWAMAASCCATSCRTRCRR